MSVAQASAPLVVDLGYVDNPAQPVLGLSAIVERTGCSAPHAHPRAQVVYASSGTMRFSAAAYTWLLPSSHLLLVPPDVRHSCFFPSRAVLKNLFLHPSVCRLLPKDCSVFRVTPLMAALIDHLVLQDEATSLTPAVAHKLQVLLDELAAAQPCPLGLPDANDPRLQKVTLALSQFPSDPRSAAQWARIAGVSAKTMERLFLSETGLTFSEWRRNLRLITAVELLEKGDDVTNVALSVGYNSLSAFIEMFKKALGVSPGAYQHSKTNGRTRPD